MVIKQNDKGFQLNQIEDKTYDEDVYYMKNIKRYLKLND